MFDARVLADRSILVTGGGSGLGLAIVREIAERHGGSVVIESAQPRGASPGTRFTVRLPIAERAP